MTVIMFRTCVTSRLFMFRAYITSRLFYSNLNTQVLRHLSFTSRNASMRPR